MVDEAKEYRRASQRYVKSSYGMWAGRDVLPWYERALFSPLYALMFWWWCLKGVPINLQKLHERDYDPKEDGIYRCPQCLKLKDTDDAYPTRSVQIEVTVEK